MKEIINLLPPEGHLFIYKHYMDGSSELVYEGKNLIVTTGKYILINQLSYTGSGDPISYAKVGTGGAFDSEGLFLKPTTVDMTDLYNPVGLAAVVKTDQDPSIPTVTLLANLDSSAGNGHFINEAGFFSTSGLMFNIKVFPGIQKDSSFSLIFKWVIKML
jgi:hypothetical protein